MTSNQLLWKLLNGVRKVALFSLIADEATDTSNKEQFCVSVRWTATAFTIHESPVELIDLPKNDAATNATVIRNCLTRFTLSLSQCRGKHTMVPLPRVHGHISGGAARIEQAEPTAILGTPVGKSLIRDATETKWPPHSMYYALLAYISAKNVSLAF